MVLRASIPFLVLAMVSRMTIIWSPDNREAYSLMNARIFETMTVEKSAWSHIKASSSGSIEPLATCVRKYVHAELERLSYMTFFAVASHRIRSYPEKNVCGALAIGTALVQSQARCGFTSATIDPIA
jgi:hypothetical protein